MSERPQWICGKCGRVLDDHQLRRSGTWLAEPVCVEPGLIAKGIRLKEK